MKSIQVTSLKDLELLQKIAIWTGGKVIFGPKKTYSIIVPTRQGNVRPDLGSWIIKTEDGFDYYSDEEYKNLEDNSQQTPLWKAFSGDDNEHMLVIFPENPSTGYVWEVDADSNKYEIVSDEYITHNDSSLIGGGGKRQIVIRMKDPYSMDVRISLRKRQPWTDRNGDEEVWIPLRQWSPNNNNNKPWTKNGSAHRWGCDPAPVKKIVEALRQRSLDVTELVVELGLPSWTVRSILDDLVSLKVVASKSDEADISVFKWLRPLNEEDLSRMGFVKS